MRQINPSLHQICWIRFFFISVLFLLILIFLWLFGNNYRLITGGSYQGIDKTELCYDSVHLAVGDILVFKAENNQNGAIRIDRMTDNWGAEYTAWVWSKKSNKINPQILSCSTGRVFELDWRIRTGNSSYVSYGGFGGERYFVCGTNEYLWMPPSIIFFMNNEEIAVFTDSETIENIIVNESATQWHKMEGAEKHRLKPTKSRE